MKKIINISVVQFLMSAISALLLSQMSWMGRMGINLFYKNYKILKSPLQTGAILFGLQFLVIIILQLVYRTMSRKTLRTVSLIVFVLACLGLAYTYYDFNQEFSHRMLKSKFHYGGYLVWVGFMLTSLYYFFQPKRKKSSQGEGHVEEAGAEF